MTVHCFVLKLLILLYVPSGIAKSTKERSCNGTHVNGKFHRQELIANGIDRPYQLSSYKNSLYFSYNTGNDTEDTFEIGHFKEGELTPIKGIKDGFATAIDRANKIVYLGGSDGIYEKKLTNSELNHVVPGNIWDLFFHHHLYFIIYPSQRLYKKVDNDSNIVEHIQNKIYQFAIDGNDDMFFTTKNGLYEIKNGTKESVKYEGPRVFRGIEIDRKGQAYFCGQNGIYVANKHNHTLREIAHIKHIFGLTFDPDNNIIYSDPHDIIRLIPGDCK